MTDNKTTQDIFSKNEFNLMYILNIIWKKKYLILIPFIFFFLKGYLQFKNIPTQYTAKCTLLSDEAIANKNTNILNITNIAGPGTNNNSTSDILPMLFSNQTFLISLLKDSIYNEDTIKITLSNYLQNSIKENDFFKINKSEKKTDKSKTITGYKNLFNKIDPLKNILELTSEEESIIEALKSKIKYTKDGRQIIISTTTTNPKISAEVTRLLLDKIITYLTKYETKKQQDNVNFLSARLEETKDKLRKNRKITAEFSDTYNGVIYETIKLNQLQLQNETSISLNTYNLLASQLEQANIDLKKQTPLFTIFEPIYIPNNSDLKSKSTIIINCFIGLIFGFIFILISLFLDFYKQNTIKQS